jgi:hypothetical protein
VWGGRIFSSISRQTKWRWQRQPWLRRRQGAHRRRASAAGALGHPDHDHTFDLSPYDRDHPTPPPHLTSSSLGQLRPTVGLEPGGPGCGTRGGDFPAVDSPEDYKRSTVVAAERFAASMDEGKEVRARGRRGARGGGGKKEPQLTQTAGLLRRWGFKTWRWVVQQTKAVELGWQQQQAREAQAIVDAKRNTERRREIEAKERADGLLTRAGIGKGGLSLIYEDILGELTAAAEMEGTLIRRLWYDDILGDANSATAAREHKRIGERVPGIVMLTPGMPRNWRMHFVATPERFSFIINIRKSIADVREVRTPSLSKESKRLREE